MQSVIKFLKNDYHDNPRAFFLETIGVPITITAALYLAIVTAGANFIFVYGMFSLGSFFLVASTFLRGNTWMLTMNIMWVFINLLGFVNAI